MPAPQDIWKKCSNILKLPSVRNCFTVVMTNKLVVIINSLKVPKIKKILLYEMKFLYQITAASITPDYGATAPRSPFSLSSTEFVEPPRTKFLGTTLGPRQRGRYNDLQRTGRFAVRTSVGAMECFFVSTPVQTRSGTHPYSY